MWVSQLATLISGGPSPTAGKREVDAVVGAAERDLLVARCRRTPGRADSAGTLSFAHLADEPEALAGDGADAALLLAAVADGAAGGVDAAGQRRVGHDAAVPDAGDQVVLADHAVAVADQEHQQVEDLRLDRDRARPRSAAPAGRGRERCLRRKTASFAPQCAARRGADLNPSCRQEKSRRPQGQIKAPQSLPSAGPASSPSARSPESAIGTEGDAR